jgi:hypothetical protein
VTPGLVDKVEAVDLVEELLDELEVELLVLDELEVELLVLDELEVELLVLDELEVELLELVVVVVVVVEVTNVCSNRYLSPVSSSNLSPVSKCMKVSAMLP